MEFHVSGWQKKEYWIASDCGEHYLWKDGTIRLGACDALNNKFTQGYWKSKQEAETFLQCWLPPKEWMTREEVKFHAVQSDNMALVASIWHWRQIIVKGIEEFRKASGEQVTMRSSYCALCQRHRADGRCILVKGCTGHCHPLWREAVKSVDEGRLDGAIEFHNHMVSLKGKNMNEIDIKLEQNQRDMDRIAEERRELLAEKKKKGDVYSKSRGYCKNILGRKKINH
jgi:hypothetical protein